MSLNVLSSSRNRLSTHDLGRVTSNSSISSGKSESHGVRASIEGAIDKLKSHGSAKDDDDEEHNRREKLKELLPSRVVSKRRRKKKLEKAEQTSIARGSKVAERGTLDDSKSLMEMKSSGSSGSLGTTVSNASLPPSFSVTQSPNLAYLATSSPYVTSDSQLQTPDRASDIAQTAASQPVLPTSSGAKRAPVSITASLQAPAELTSKRPLSPVSKIKDAFSSRRNVTPTVIDTGAKAKDPSIKHIASDTDIVKRRGSVSARLGAIFPERAAHGNDSQTSLDKPKPKVPFMLDTDERPVTPPSTKANAAPTIISTPPTPTEPSSSRFPKSPPSSNPNIVTSPSGNMISHRRIRSGSGATNNIGPSKLSHSTAAPLTPMPENGTGGAELQGAQTGFFSSVFSAAQNAANTLSNSITTLPGQQRGRSATLQNETSTKPMEDVEVDTPDDSRLRSSSDGKEPAVKTLGMGELSLSALGLSDTPSEANTPVNATFDSNMPLKSSATTAEVKDDIVRSATAGPAIVGDKGESIVIADDPSHSRSFSAYESSGLGDQSPRNGSILDGKPGRSNSIRSALGATRRHRGSSAATGTTVGAAIAESGNLGTSVSQPKVTGFAVASKKRNKDFHALFKSVPEDDYLIEDYSCALQREILAHGRLYVSEGHLCFSSNILGWVTTLVMSFDEIVSVEKRNTALLFKNGLMISTLHSRNIFASFTSRDSTYELITGIWKLGHPGLRSSLNGVRIDETGGGDKTEKDDVGEVASVEAESEAEGSDGEFYDEDDEYSHVDSFTDGEGSIASSLIIPKKTASAPATNGALSGSEKKDTSITPAAVDFPGPVTHAPTECNCGGDHYEKVIADEVIAAPMGKIYNLMFGPASVQWLANLLVNDMKGTEFSFEQKIGLSKDNKTRKYEYIKPLFGAIGPKSTKCITSEVLDFFDLEKAVTVVVSTQTPDVPSGNVFVTKTKYCLSWAENGGTRIVMSCVIEWSGKSWLKGPIEKGANDGQSTYAKDIVAALRATISSKRSSGAPGAKKGKKGAKRRTVSRSSPKPVAVTTKTEDWGVLEPLHGILGPVVDIVKPLLSPNIVYGLLVGLLVAFWFGFGRSPPPSDRYGLGWSSSERVAAYEEIWRREENELWDWLEARVGANERRLHGSAGLAQQVGGLEYREASPEVQRGIRESLDEEVGGDLDVREAIRVTEEKLEALKKMVERNASGKNDRKEKGKGGNDTA